MSAWSDGGPVVPGGFRRAPAPWAAATPVSGDSPSVRRAGVLSRASTCKSPAVLAGTQGRVAEARLTDCVTCDRLKMRDVHAGGGPACFARRVLTPGLRSRAPRRGRRYHEPVGNARQGEEPAQDSHHGATRCRTPRWCQSFPRRCRPFAHSLGDGPLKEPGLPGLRGHSSSSRPPEDPAGLDRGEHDTGAGPWPRPRAVFFSPTRDRRPVGAPFGRAGLPVQAVTRSPPRAPAPGIALPSFLALC